MLALLCKLNLAAVTTHTTSAAIPSMKTMMRTQEDINYALFCLSVMRDDFPIDSFQTLTHSIHTRKTNSPIMTVVTV